MKKIIFALLICCSIATAQVPSPSPRSSMKYDDLLIGHYLKFLPGAILDGNGATVTNLNVPGAGLPSQIGNSGLSLYTNGVTPFWSPTTFASLTSKPTTLFGYGITDGVDINSAQAIIGQKTFNQLPNFPLVQPGYVLGVPGAAGSPQTPTFFLNPAGAFSALSFGSTDVMPTGCITIVHADNTRTWFKPSANTTAARGASFLAAWTMAVDGETILVANGDYDCPWLQNQTKLVNIIGAGKNKTIFTNRNPDPSGGTSIGYNLLDFIGDNMWMQGFTVDCNYAILTATNTTIGGAHLKGNNNTFFDVRVTNFHNDAHAEVFALGAGARDSQVGYNDNILFCEVDHGTGGAGNGGTSLIVGGADDGTCSGHPERGLHGGVVAYNYVHDSPSCIGLGAGACTGVKFVHNHVYNCLFGFNRDSYTSVGNEISDNSFEHCHQFGITWRGGAACSSVDKDTVSRNYISMTGERSDSWGVGMIDPFETNSTVSDNTVAVCQSYENRDGGGCGTGGGDNCCTGTWNTFGTTAYWLNGGPGWAITGNKSPVGSSSRINIISGSIIRDNVDEQGVPWRGNFTAKPMWQNGNKDYAFSDLNTYDSNFIDERLVGLSPGSSAQNIYSTRNDAGGGTYVRSGTNFLQDVDLTPIAVYNDSATHTQNATLISPRHVVMANHYFPANGTNFRFVDQNGTVITRQLVSSGRIGSTDLQIGILDSDVPKSISFAKILTAQDRMAGSPLVWVDQNFKMWLVDTVISTGLDDLTSTNPPSESNRSPYATSPVAGDSSHPMFWIVNGQMALGGLADCGTPCAPSLTANAAAINTEMATLCSTNCNYQLTTLNKSQLGSAANFNASTAPNAGWIPVTNNSNLLAANIMNVTADNVPNIRLQLTRTTFSNANFNDAAFGNSQPLKHYLAQVGSLSTANVNVTLPDNTTVCSGAVCEPTIGAIMMVADESGTCDGTHTITIASHSGSTSIDGGNVVLSSPYSSVILQYAGTGSYHVIYGNGIYLIAAITQGGLGEIALSTGTAADVQTLSLTPGDWDVTGVTGFDEVSATVTARSSSIGTNLNTITADGSEGYLGANTSASTQLNTISLTRKRFTIKTNTTIHQVAKATFTGTSVSAFGSITARKIK